MATKRQIADLNASVTLYAKQYIDELTRVGRLTKTTTAGMGKDMATVAKSTQVLNAAQVTGGRTGRRYGMVMQNAGYQVQDFAVQVAGGQNAMRAFSQQAPQMLGFLGPGGAIAGAVISVGALAMQMANLGKETKSSAEKIRDFDQATRDFQKARTDYQFGLLSDDGKRSNLEGRIQENMAEIQRLMTLANANPFREAMKEIGRQRASMRDGDASRALLEEYNRLEDLAEGAEAAGTTIRELQKEVVNLREQLASLGKTTAGKDSSTRVKAMMKELQAYADEQNEITEGIVESQRRRAEAYKREGEALMRSVITPHERYAEVVADLDRRLKDKNITQEAYNRLVADAANKLDRATTSARKLRTETLSIAEIANAGGGSSNASKARRALDIRERAKEAEARGNFSFADKLYAQAQSVEGRIKRRERTFDAEMGTPAGIPTTSTGAPSAPAGEPAGREISVRSNALDEIKRILEGLENSVAVA